MSTQADFWGDIEAPVIRTPLSILREQAALLGKKTRNLVSADVETHGDSGVFRHFFNLIVPALDYDKYELFKIQHKIDLYPVIAPGGTLKNEAEFEEWLRQRLSAGETKEIIGKLLAQATS